MEYTVSEILSMLYKRMWIIMICVILWSFGTYGITKLFIDERYAASVSMYAAPINSGTDIYASLNMLNYAKQVVNTYIEILCTNAFLNSVAKESRLNYSVNELKKMITIKVVGNTEIFRVQVVTKDPKESLLLANTVARLAPRKILEIRNVDAVKIVDPAVIPEIPSSPNILLNTVAGFAVGLFSGILLAFISGIFDKRIKDEDDLLKRYSVPLLGVVPTIEG